MSTGREEDLKCLNENIKLIMLIWICQLSTLNIHVSLPMKIFYILSLFLLGIFHAKTNTKIQHVYCTALNEVCFSHLKSSSLSFRQLNVDQTVAPFKCQQLNEIKKKKINQYLTYDSHAFFIEPAWGPGVKSTTKTSGGLMCTSNSSLC